MSKPKIIQASPYWDYIQVRNYLMTEHNIGYDEFKNYLTKNGYGDFFNGGRYWIDFYDYDIENDTIKEIMLREFSEDNMEFHIEW